MSVNYEWRHVLIDLDADDAWAEVNKLCEEGWEVNKILEKQGSLSTVTVVYLRNPKGFYTHTKTCPKCHKPCPYC
jgi:hypothetical protein